MSGHPLAWRVVVSERLTSMQKGRVVAVGVWGAGRTREGRGFKRKALVIEAHILAILQGARILIAVIEGAGRSKRFPPHRTWKSFS